MSEGSGCDNQLAYFLFQDPPPWILAIWAGGLALTATTVYLTCQLVSAHVAAAKASGFGGNLFVRESYGPRADRLLHLLAMPGLFSATALVQLLFPRAEPLCVLWRSIQAALAMVRLTELLYILSGGWSNVKLRLPTEPIKPYAGLPLCCLFMWERCTKQVTDWDIGVMTMGVRQFSFVTPVLGTLDAYFSPMGVRGSAAATTIKVVNALYVVSTVVGIWSFNNLFALLSYSSPHVHRKLAKVRLLSVSLQMLSVKLISAIIETSLRDHSYDNGNWVLHGRHLASLASGCYLCLVELLLAFVARRAFPVGDAMYPPPDYSPNGYPVDMLAAVELCGVPNGVYPMLKQFERSGRDADSTDDDSSSEE